MQSQPSLFFGVMIVVPRLTSKIVTRSFVWYLQKNLGRGSKDHGHIKVFIYLFISLLGWQFIFIFRNKAPIEIIITHLYK
jgi:hypothetical protein